MSSAHLTTKSPMSPSPLVQLRIARCRLVMAWRESDHLLALTVLGAFAILLLAPIVYVLVMVW
jgi:hypothetical protein